MSDAQFAFDGMTLAELQDARKALYGALTSGAEMVQYSDGSRVQYRSTDDVIKAMSLVDARIAGYLPPADPARAPVRGYVMRPWNGYY